MPMSEVISGCSSEAKLDWILGWYTNILGWLADLEMIWR